MANIKSSSFVNAEECKSLHTIHFLVLSRTDLNPILSVSVIHSNWAEPSYLNKHDVFGYMYWRNMERNVLKCVFLIHICFLQWKDTLYGYVQFVAHNLTPPRFRKEVP